MLDCLGYCLHTLGTDMVPLYTFLRVSVDIFPGFFLDELYIGIATLRKHMAYSIPYHFGRKRFYDLAANDDDNICEVNNPDRTPH